MQIYSVKKYSANNYYPKNLNFTAHPDFYKYNSTLSCYFRRGLVAAANNEGYANVENLFQKIFSSDLNKPKKMLIFGIGNSQEPFSYLASIKGIIQDCPLNKNIDLYIVDLQSKPTYNKLRLDAFPALWLDKRFPQYAGKSFIKDVKNPRINVKSESFLSPLEYNIYTNMYQPPLPEKEYRVNDEILNFVNETYNNSEKSKWDSRIQDVIVDYSDNEFDIISANNVFGYLSDNDYLKTINHVKRTLKTTDGYFITDPCLQDVINSEESRTFRKIYPGIYQKI